MCNTLFSLFANTEWIDGVVCECGYSVCIIGEYCISDISLKQMSYQDENTVFSLDFERDVVILMHDLAE